MSTDSLPPIQQNYYTSPCGLRVSDVIDIDPRYDAQIAQLAFLARQKPENVRVYAKNFALFVDLNGVELPFAVAITPNAFDYYSAKLGKTGASQMGYTMIKTEPMPIAGATILVEPPRSFPQIKKDEEVMPGKEKEGAPVGTPTPVSPLSCEKSKIPAHNSATTVHDTIAPPAPKPPRPELDRVKITIVINILLIVAAAFYMIFSPISFVPNPDRQIAVTPTRIAAIEIKPIPIDLRPLEIPYKVEQGNTADGFNAALGFPLTLKEATDRYKEAVARYRDPKAPGLKLYAGESQIIQVGSGKSVAVVTINKATKAKTVHAFARQAKVRTTWQEAQILPSFEHIPQLIDTFDLTVHNFTDDIDAIYILNGAELSCTVEVKPNMDYGAICGR